MVERKSTRKNIRFKLSLGFLVGRTGFEPVTNGLKVHCSTS
jgi:hypothetical protein